MRRKLLSLVGALLFLLSPTGATISVAQNASFAQPNQQTSRFGEWRKQLNELRKTAQSPATNDFSGETYGFVNAPDGSTWMYTATFEMTENYSYKSVTVNIYDASGELKGTLTDEFDFSDNEYITGVNMVQVNPLITQKFFNLDSNYEIMLFCHATTTDYEGYYFNDIFPLTTDGKANKLTRIDGNQILAKNTAVDKWSENYTMVFQREKGDELLFDIYSKAGYGDVTCKLEHTFKVGYDLIEGMDENAFPILMQKVDGKMVYVLAHYEIPFFDPDVPMGEDFVVQPNNNLLISIYDENFEETDLIKIPVPDKGDYLAIAPYLGGMRYNDDLAYDFLGDGELSIIVTFNHHLLASEQIIKSFYVYNRKGERVKTIAEKTNAHFQVSNLPGEPEQHCFVYEGTQTYLSFVDLPEMKEVARIPSILEGLNISTNLDRYPVGDDYQYVVSLAYGENDEENTIHTIAWITKDAKIDHLDKLQLGEEIQYGDPYINALSLNPWLFATDDTREYMIRVKKILGYEGENLITEERLRIVNTEGKTLLDLGSDPEKGVLNLMMLMNVDTKPVLAVTYCSEDYIYTTQIIDLPLTKFAGGSGTKEDPYQIATAGDLKQIETELAAHYVVTNDIDFQSLPFSGVQGNFTGSLDGKGHLFNNLVLHNTGLFTQAAENNAISNIRLYRPELVLNDAASTTVGFIVNDALNQRTIENIYIYSPVITATPEFNGDLGCIAGQTATYTKVQQCRVTDANIQGGTGYVGGIVGETWTSSELHACAFDGHIEGNIVGGLVGQTAKGDEIITNCHVNAEVIGLEQAGGLIGNSNRSAVKNCYAEGTVTLQGSDNGWEYAAGGLIGYQAPVASTPGKIIQNNLVGITAITLSDDLADNKDVTSHRIVGFSSDDDEETDWDATANWTQEDWEAYEAGEKELPTIPGRRDEGLQHNYVISSLPVCDPQMEVSDSTLEGATLAPEKVTTDFLTAQNFAAGNTIDAPWVHNAKPYLWFEKEVGELIVDNANPSIRINEKQTITFSILGGKGEDIQFTGLDNKAIQVDKKADKDYATLTITAVSKATVEITATYGEQTIKVTVICHNYIMKDAEEGTVDRKYTDDDNLVINDYLESDGYILLSIDEAEGADRIELYFYTDKADENTTIPVGTYTINDTKNAGTVQASTGIDGLGQLVPSYYTVLTSGIPTKPYFLVNGTITIGTDTKGEITMVMDAVNSYDLPVHIEYIANPTAIEHTNADGEQVEKVIRNGQLYIIRNGHTYTATGVMVE